MAASIKFLVFLLLGAATGYEVGKEYIYTYDGKLRVTQPEVKTQSVGLAFRSRVVVQPRPNHTHFKVVDFEADVVNADVIDFETHEFQYEPHPALVENVGRTFAAKFTHGKFENIELAKDEPLWSQNVKKALVSLLQVDLTAHRENPHASEYTVLEDGINGVCETLYVLSPDGHHHEHVDDGEEHHGAHGTHPFRTGLTKVKNLEKCTNSPVAFLGSFRGQQCSDCVSRDTPPFVNTAEVKYGLRGTPHGFVIEHACGSASRVYVPFNEGKVVTAFVNRTLRLIQETEATTDTTLPEELEIHTTLAHVFPVARDVRTPEDLKRRNRFSEDMHLSTDYQKFIQLFNELVQVDFTEADYKDALHGVSAAEKFLRAFHAFGTFTYEQMGEFYDSVVNGPEAQEEHPARSVFLDLLVATGTNPAIAFGLHLVQSGQMSPSEAKRFFAKLPLNVKEPSEAVAHAIIDTCKTDFIKSNDSLEGTCLMAVGSLIEYNCDRAKTDEETDGRLCHPDIVGRFFNYAVSYEDVQHQTCRLNSMYAEIGGKLATRNAIHSLARFVGHHIPCLRLRTSALWALARAGHRQPRLVRQVALPVYKNTSESYEVRIAAFVAVVSTNPDLYFLRHIARAIIDDPSDQLASYVTSYFREFANSDYPCFRSWARRFRYVVPLWNDVRRFKKPLDSTKSRVTVSSGYDPKYNYGSMTKKSVIQSEDSDLPRSVYVGAKDYIAGFSHDSVSVLYQGWGVDRLVALLYGPRPGSKRNLWGLHGRHRLRRNADERRELEDRLPITPRTYAPFAASIKVSVFGHTVYDLELDERHLGSLTQPQQPGGTPADFLMHLLGRQHKSRHYYLSRDMIWFFPTDLGFVFFLDVKKADFIYANRDQATFQHSDGKCQLGYKRHYLYDSSAYEVLGVGLTFKKTSFGAGYYKRTAVSLPMNLHATYDTRTHKLKLERPLSLPMDMFSYKFKPYTFVEGFDNTVPATSPGAEFPHNTLPLYRDEELKDYERTYFADLLGCGFHVKSQLIKKGLRQGLHRFWHDMDWRQRFYYLYVNPHWHPRSLTIEAVAAETDPTHSIELDFGYRSHHTDDVMSHGNAIDDENADDPGAVVHVVNADVHFRGATRNRSVATELTYSHSNDILKHHVTFLYDRTPFLQSEQSNMKICLDTTAAFPRPEWSKMDNIGGFLQGLTIDVTASLAYGADCATGSRISAHGTYEHTDADAEEIENIVSDRPEGRDRFQQNKLQMLYRKCRLGQERGMKYNHYCVKYAYHTSRLGKLNLDVEYHNLRSLLPRAYHHYHEHRREHAGFFHVVSSHFTGPDGQLRVVSQVPAFQGGRYADVTVTVPANVTDASPLHDRVYRHEDVPTFSHLLEPRVFIYLGYTNLEEYSAKYRHETCDVQGDGGVVNTFDGVSVPLPETDCYKVLARDCSPNSQFVVLARKLPSPTFPKALKMFIGDVKVEILPSADDTGVVVTVDDERVVVTEDHPYSHRVDGAELFYAHFADRWYLIGSNTRGLMVAFGGHSVFVQVAPFYRGKMCGLCGDYNYERHHELRGPDGRLYDDSLDFAASYVVPSEDCTLGTRNATGAAH